MDDDFERCIRNERKLDMLENKLDTYAEQKLKVELAIENVAGRVIALEGNQRHIMKNDLKHIPTYDEAFTKRPRDVGILVAGITAISSIVTATLMNLDKIIEFINYVKTLIGII